MTTVGRISLRDKPKLLMTKYTCDNKCETWSERYLWNMILYNNGVASRVERTGNKGQEQHTHSICVQAMRQWRGSVNGGFVLTPNTAIEPNLCFVCNERLHSIASHHSPSKQPVRTCRALIRNKSNETFDKNIQFNESRFYRKKAKTSNKQPRGGCTLMFMRREHAYYFYNLLG